MKRLGSMPADRRNISAQDFGARFMPAFAPSSFLGGVLPGIEPAAGGRRGALMFPRRQHSVRNVQE
jgi:hypothetical protein